MQTDGPRAQHTPRGIVLYRFKTGQPLDMPMKDGFVECLQTATARAHFAAARIAFGENPCTAPSAAS